jgi:hypothetical protein
MPGRRWPWARSGKPSTASPSSLHANFEHVPYSSGFSGSSPLGPGVTINPVTGLISGTAPSTPGEYVVTVCVNEFKNGVLIASNRKELHIKVAIARPFARYCGLFTPPVMASPEPLPTKYRPIRQ